MGLIATPRDWVAQPPGVIASSRDIFFDFAWSADNLRGVGAGPRVSGGTVALKGVPGEVGISNGYLILASDAIPSLFATTWTEIGSVFLDGVNQVITLSSRGTSQSVMFAPATPKVDLVVWSVADVDISGGALPVGVVNYVARRIGNNHTVWLNGKLYGTASNASTAATAGILPAIGSDAGSGGNQGVRAIAATSAIMMVARTPRGLSDAQCIAYSRNPWAVFEPEDDIIYVSTNTGIAFDAAANSGDVAAASSYSGSASWSGTNRMLSVDVSMLGAGVTVSSMTYGGAACTLIGAKSTVTSFGRVESWRICSSDSGAPAAGANTLVVTLSGSLEFTVEWASYTGVNQSLPVEGFNSAQATNVGSATDASVSITSVADNCWIHGAVVANDTSITANQTTRNNISGTLGSGGNEDNNAAKTPAGAVTMSYSGMGITTTWAIAGYAIRPLAASNGHTSVGILIGQGSTIAGTATHKTKHTTTGALVGQGSAIAGVAKHWHKGVGVLVGQGSTIVGTARRFRAHPASGSLVGQGSTVAGTAVHAATGNHPTSGSLVGQGSLVVGAAKHTTKHATVGILIGQGSIVSGSAAGPTAPQRFNIQAVSAAGIVFDETLLMQLRNLGINPNSVILNGIVQTETLAAALQALGINPAVLRESGAVFNETILRQIQNR